MRGGALYCLDGCSVGMAGGLGQGGSCAVCLPPLLHPLPRFRLLLLQMEGRQLACLTSNSRSLLHPAAVFTPGYGPLTVVMRPSCLAQVDCGAMCMPGAAEKVQELIDDAVAKGAKVGLSHS